MVVVVPPVVVPDVVVPDVVVSGLVVVDGIVVVVGVPGVPPLELRTTAPEAVLTCHVPLKPIVNALCYDADGRPHLPVPGYEGEVTALGDSVSGNRAPASTRTRTVSPTRGEGSGAIV